MFDDVYVKGDKTRVRLPSSPPIITAHLHYLSQETNRLPIGDVLASIGSQLAQTENR